ncbi:Uncharacterised protein [Vibrio cholerae]|nr:Uncharacterised protein [Vibrio cholerae]
MCIKTQPFYCAIGMAPLSRSATQKRVQVNFPLF